MASDYPIGGYAVGDVINISGTTNLPANTSLRISADPKSFTNYEQTPTINLPGRFLRNTIDNDYTISYSWQRATQNTYNSSVTARVIFDTNDQLQNDHLSGQGSVAANEAVDDNTMYKSTWAC